MQAYTGNILHDVQPAGSHGLEGANKLHQQVLLLSAVHSEHAKTTESGPYHHGNCDKDVWTATSCAADTTCKSTAGQCGAQSGQGYCPPQAESPTKAQPGANVQKYMILDLEAWTAVCEATHQRCSPTGHMPTCITLTQAVQAIT